MFKATKATLFLLFLLLGIAASASASTTTFSHIEDMTSWDSCTACAGAGGNAIYWMKQGITSPTLDGKSAQFFVGGSTSFSHGLWWRRMSSNTTATHFTLDMYYYMKDPASSQGLEFAVNQSKDDKWYKFSTQCSFGGNQWRVWDSKNGGWVNTGISCNRPKALTWTHVVFEYARSSGKAQFVSITVNGTKHYVSKSFYPQAKSASGSVGVHFELNGNRTQSDYMVWMDKMKLTYY